MAQFNILLAIFLFNFAFFVSAGPLIPRQGCTSGSTTTGANGQTLTCGGDGRYYDGNGQVVTQTGQTGSSNQGGGGSQQSGSGCTVGSTTTGANGQTLTCGGDGRYYDGNGQPASQTGQSGGSSQGSASTQPSGQGCTSGSTTTGANGQTLTCGGDGRYYDGSGQPVAQTGSGQTQKPNPQSNPASTVVQQSSSGGAPAGWSVGFSTQDHENPGQQSGCSTYCSANSFIHANTQIGPGGALAAAINPAMLGGDVCATCGICFNIINAGIAAPDGPGGPSPQQATNQQIKVWIVNSCTNCATNQFDINDCPAGWDNPKVYYQQVPC